MNFFRSGINQDFEVTGITQVTKVFVFCTSVHFCKGAEGSWLHIIVSVESSETHGTWKLLRHMEIIYSLQTLEFV